MFRTSIVRSSRSLAARSQTIRMASTASTPISNPTLANIEKRWEGMPPQEQAELWMSLRDRMKVNWAELTPQEKKAAYYIAFGAHGPRAATPPGEGWRVAAITAAGVGVSLVLFGAIRVFSKGTPSTMNKEWQEATNEMLKEQRSEPISGISAEGYSGPGMVQSAPKRK
ncbi:Cytochrome c oxidase subunit 5B, mitochondrial [Clarireedia jacksonii]